MSKPRALLSWSSGKDSAWTLHRCHQAGDLDIVGLVTTLNENADRVAMHAVRHELLRRQAAAAGLPLFPVGLPAPCSNDEYLGRVGGEFQRLKRDLGVTHVVFGDLFLADIRAWRERQMADLGLEATFPLWGEDTTRLADEMLAGGLEAHLACVDSAQLAAEFSGQAFDRVFLDDLPDGVDPCGENGEFHTLVTAGPMFSQRINIERGEQRVDGPFVFTDFRPAD